MSPSAEPLTVQKLDELLVQTLGNDIQIKHVEWRSLTAPGDHFGSLMTAITVLVARANNKTETLHLVAKIPPTSAYLLDLFNSPVTFKKELYFYSSMSKELLNLQLECGINEQDLMNLVPKFFGGRLGLRNPEKFDEQAAIVLENLKYSGYDTEDRIYGLDRNHTEFAIQELSKLHALTIALKLKKPELYEKIAELVLMDVLNESTEKCVMNMVKKAQSDAEQIEELKPYLDRISRTIDYCVEANKMEKVEEPWSTLVHNDFWVNNMMFRNNERGDVIDMKIVDFQLCVSDYGIKDLIFFLVSSANTEILDNKLDDMLDLYYSCFVKILKKLQVDTKKFSKEKFDEIVNHCAPLKFVQCLMMAQVIQAPRELATDTRNFKDDDVFTDITGNDIYLKKLTHIVHLFDKRGWLLK